MFNLNAQCHSQLYTRMQSPLAHHQSILPNPELQAEVWVLQWQLLLLPATPPDALWSSQHELSPLSYGLRAKKHSQFQHTAYRNITVSAEDINCSVRGKKRKKTYVRNCSFLLLVLYTKLGDFPGWTSRLSCSTRSCSKCLSPDSLLQRCRLPISQGISFREKMVLSLYLFTFLWKEHSSLDQMNQDLWLLHHSNNFSYKRKRLMFCVRLESCCVCVQVCVCVRI